MLYFATSVTVIITFVEAKEIDEIDIEITMISLDLLD